MIDNSNKGPGIIQSNTNLPAQRESEKLLNRDQVESLKNVGAIQVDAKTGKTDVKAPIHHQGAPDRSGLPGALSTLKSKFGTPINDMSKVTDDSIVTVGRIEMPVKIAVQQGLLIRQADGALIDPNADAVEAQKAQEQANQKKVEVSFTDSNQRAQLREMADRISKQQTDVHIHKLLSSMVTGRDGAQAVSEFSQALGANPESIVTFTEDLANGLVEKGAAYLEKRYGVDAEAVSEYMSEHVPPSQQASLLMSLYHGSLADLDRLYFNFKNGNRG